MINRLAELFLAHFHEEVQEITSLGAHASERRIYRVRGKKAVAIGIENGDRAENRAFIEFTRHFRKNNLPVPEVYAEDLDAGVYLEEDLGDVTLYHILSRSRTDQSPFPPEVEEIYKKVLAILPHFQIRAGRDLDYSICHQASAYGRDSMLWDMHYFEESFLAQSGHPFDKIKLREDFERFADHLLGAESTFFLYRDLQSRNVMIRDGEPWFIDYQGGRRGALQYDVASLLYQSSAAIPEETRRRLIDYYLDAVETLVPLDRGAFLKHFDAFVLIRMMQVLGTYGKQGIGLGKKYFLESIPFAVRNITDVVARGGLPDNLPELSAVFRTLSEKAKGV